MEQELEGVAISCLGVETAFLQHFREGHLLCAAACPLLRAQVSPTILPELRAWGGTAGAGNLAQVSETRKGCESCFVKCLPCPSHRRGECGEGQARGLGKCEGPGRLALHVLRTGVTGQLRTEVLWGGRHVS